MSTHPTLDLAGEDGRDWLADRAHWGSVLDALPDAVAIVGPDGTIAFANRQLHRLAGYAPGALADSPVEVLVPADLRGAHRAHRRRFVARPELRPMGAGLDISCRRSDGTEFPADISLSPVVTPLGVYTVCVVRDATERRRTEEELFHRAVHDPLTGLANRSLLLDRLGHRLRVSGRNHTPAAVLFLDVDRFKAVNDRFGHAAGDEVLRALARRMEEVVRDGDTVARFGGDEFVVLCEELSDERSAEEIASRFLEATARPVDVGGSSLDVSVSIGVAVGQAGLVTAEELLAAADRALYRAKAAGRGRYVVAGHDAPAGDARSNGWRPGAVRP